VKLITGDTNQTASKAADVIKRLLRPLEQELDGDLREGRWRSKVNRPCPAF
jgi:hypothetical protein